MTALRLFTRVFARVFARLPHPLRLLPAALLLWVGAAHAQLPLGALSGQAGDTVRTNEVQARLLAHAPQGLQVPGSADEAANAWLGLQITHQPGWHTYWKNPGDSGLATELHWTLPPGVQVGDIVWPLPHKLPFGDLVNYGYEGTVLLPVPLRLTPDFQPGPLPHTLDIGLHATWLVCATECIPQEGHFSLKLALNGSSAHHGPAFEAALAAQPSPLPGPHDLRLQSNGQRLQLRVSGLPEAVHGQPLELFTEAPGVITTAAKLAAPGQPLSADTWAQQWDGPVWTADVPVATQRMESPAHMAWVLTNAQGQGWRAEAAVQGQWPAEGAPAELPAALNAALQANQAPSPAQAGPAAPPAPGHPGTPAWLAALLGALIGGMALNLMPCVFPVLAIKVLGFAQHGGNARALRVGALAYSAGVLLSFLALGALMLGLRAAGQQLGWGFQLQSPWVIAGLATLFTLIGLNLAGLFAFGHILPSRLAAAQARHPVANDALSGVLAVAVASPCTAPFMGAALGLTVALPAWQALAIFAAIGAGMALPYLVLSFWPALSNRLPRPGAWMQTLRQLLAFPMLGAAIWLLWVLGQQVGIDGAAALLTLLLALAMLLWALGQQGRARAWLSGAALALGGLLLWAIGPHITRLPDASAANSAANSTASGHWQAWSPEHMQARLNAGQTVLVDFTAAWCVTCQYNKKTTLADPRVLAALDAAGIQTLRADWTRRDPRISATLQSLGRNGVPVYLLQAPRQPPVLLSELPSVDEILQAIAALKH